MTQVCPDNEATTLSDGVAAARPGSVMIFCTPATFAAA